MVGVLIHVVCYDSLSNSSIIIWFLLIKHDEEEIESGQQGVWQSNVLSDRLISGILTVNWVRGRNDTASGIKSCMNTSFGNSDGLLFHNLMDSNSISIVHLIKLIDTDNTSISKDHCTGFKMSLARILVNTNSCSETDA